MMLMLFIVLQEGSTALIKASSEGHLEIVRLLLQQPSIDVNTKDYVSDDMLFDCFVIALWKEYFMTSRFYFVASKD